jgi:16S rRNA (cytidine1402-2'-O)-methyltransferase
LEKTLHPEPEIAKVKGALYVVATPIGNLRDISLRALEILKSADIIAAEDTRNSGHLLSHFGIAARMVALHEHNEVTATPGIIGHLRDGKVIALISDAGTPGISDPGAVLVKAVREAGLPVIPIPGANAAVCALSAAGMSAPHFLFYGFLPARPGHRRQALETLKTLPYTLVFYEAPHRIMETVADLATVLGEDREISFARELTKLFEQIHVCRLGEATAWLQADPNRQRGEFVLLLSGAVAVAEAGVSEEARRTLLALLAELPLKQAVKLAAEISGEKKNTLYELALQLK